MEVVSVNYYDKSRFYSTVSLSKTIESFRPRKNFVKKLIELRLTYINSGGKIYSIEEINKELSEGDEE